MKSNKEREALLREQMLHSSAQTHTHRALTVLPIPIVGVNSRFFSKTAWTSGATTGHWHRYDAGRGLNLRL